MLPFAHLPFRKLFLLFWGITLLLYSIAWRSGFERDFHGWFELYYNLPFKDMLNRKGSGITSLYQVTQLQLWFWTRLFGTHLLPWFLLQTGLYAAAGATVTCFLRNLYADFNWRTAAQIAFWGGLLSLVAPHNAEITLWKASYHYPVGVLFIFGILLLFRRFLFTGDTRFLAMALLLYAISTYTLELFYTTLPLTGLLLLLYYRNPAISATAYRKGWIWGIPVMTLLFVHHFIVYRLVYQGVVPHIEGPVRRAIEHPWQAFGRIFQNEYHLLLQGRYWPVEWTQKVFAFTDKPVAGMMALSLALLVIGIAVIAAIRNPKYRPVLFLVAGAALGLLLIIPSEVMRDGLYHNDRLKYFTGLFQWALVAVALYRLLPSRAATVGAFLLMVLLGALSFYTALQCRRSIGVFWNALDNFRWSKESGTFLLLNVPANYKLIVQFQEGPDNCEFASHLNIYKKQKVAGKLLSVAGFNMVVPESGVQVVVEDRTHLRVTNRHWGAWFWSGALGASNHQNAIYKMTLDELSHSYKMELKDTSARLLFFNNRQWKEVDFSRPGAVQE